MATDITLKTLLRHFYKETSAEQNTQIAATLESNWLLKEEYKMMTESLNELDQLKTNPAQKSIDAILEYSRMSTPVDA